MPVVFSVTPGSLRSVGAIATAAADPAKHAIAEANVTLTMVLSSTRPLPGRIFQEYCNPDTILFYT